MSDLDLMDAVRALRDEPHASPAPADATRMRILTTVRAARRRRIALVRATAVLLAASLGGVAWAAATGRLPPLSSVFSDASETVSEGASESGSASGRASEPQSGSWTAPTQVADSPVPERPTPTAGSAPSAAESASHEAGQGAPAAAGRPQASQTHAASTATATAIATATAAVIATAASAAPSAPSASPVASAAPPDAAEDAAQDPADTLYHRAHALHFQSANWSAARAAWDAYLAAAPSGRFATFAHYNRALCLLRLGQLTEARRVLSLFASGAFGGYRRAEAQSLLDALDSTNPPSR